jgi:translation elongation factor EF-1alpha
MFEKILKIERRGVDGVRRELEDVERKKGMKSGDTIEAILRPQRPITIESTESKYEFPSGLTRLVIRDRNKTIGAGECTKILSESDV